MVRTLSALHLAALSLPALATEMEHLARQTSPAERFDQAIAPRAPQATPPPQARWAGVDADVLFGRQASLGSDTCGYISGTESFYPLTCGSGYTCTNSGIYRGCCRNTACSASTGYLTTCYDATATECSASSVGVNTLCCTYSASYPYCLTYLWSTTASPGNVFTEFNCDASAFSGQYFLAAETPSTTSTSSSTSSSGTSSSSTTSSSAVSAPTPSSSTPSSNSGSSNTGAIVGGVVGGVAVLALIAFGIWFFLHKKKQHPPQQSQMAQSAGYPSPPPPGVPGYDPRYSYVGAHGQLSPSAPTYPSPSGSPAQFYGGQPGHGHESWQGQGQQGYMYPENTGHTMPPTQQAEFGTVGDHGAKGPAEVDSGVNRAELA
ncbi:hypothetical protein SUNI508_00768 [Seiridium unicorne]|uniref:Uncharacterized protein n=1 Tax=Seiridium unicorne TaxID=138068 RepID=A0ABR2V1A6_9PEZI